MAGTASPDSCASAACACGRSAVLRPARPSPARDSPVAPNLLLERPPAERINQVWLTDITYIPTAQGWLCLAAEMDAFRRRILGWSTHATLHTGLPLAALDRALRHRAGAPLPDLIHHSDRGCQLPRLRLALRAACGRLSRSARLTSSEFRHRLSLCRISQSMSRKANCYDNAAIESFWATQIRMLRLLHPSHSRRRSFHDL